jgi:hypothetical protein
MTGLVSPYGSLRYGVLDKREGILSHVEFFRTV